MPAEHLHQMVGLLTDPTVRYDADLLSQDQVWWLDSLGCHHLSQSCFNAADSSRVQHSLWPLPAATCPSCFTLTFVNDAVRAHVSSLVSLTAVAHIVEQHIRHATHAVSDPNPETGGWAVAACSLAKAAGTVRRRRRDVAIWHDGALVPAEFDAYLAKLADQLDVYRHRAPAGIAETLLRSVNETAIAIERTTGTLTTVRPTRTVPLADGALEPGCLTTGGDVIVWANYFPAAHDLAPETMWWFLTGQVGGGSFAVMPEGAARGLLRLCSSIPVTIAENLGPVQPGDERAMPVAGKLIADGARAAAALEAARLLI